MKTIAGVLCEIACYILLAVIVTVEFALDRYYDVRLWINLHVRGCY